MIVEELRSSTQLPKDPLMPPSTRTAALVHVKALAEQLMRIDEADHQQPL